MFENAFGSRGVLPRLPTRLGGLLLPGTGRQSGFSLTSSTLTINIGTGRHYLCALDPAHTAGNASFDAVSPEVCAAMYGTFLTAKTSGRSVKFWYSSAGSTPDCQWGAQDDWAIPDPYPYYLEIVD